MDELDDGLPSTEMTADGWVVVHPVDPLKSQLFREYSWQKMLSEVGTHCTDTFDSKGRLIILGRGNWSRNLITTRAQQHAFNKFDLRGR